MTECKIFHQMEWTPYPGDTPRAVPRCETHNCNVLATPGRCVVGALEDLADRLEAVIVKRKRNKEDKEDDYWD